MSGGGSGPRSRKRGPGASAGEECSGTRPLATGNGHMADSNQDARREERVPIGGSALLPRAALRRSVTKTKKTCEQ